MPSEKMSVKIWSCNWSITQGCKQTHEQKTDSESAHVLEYWWECLMMMIYNRYTLLIGSLDIMCDLSQDIICIYREREGEWVTVCVCAPQEGVCLSIERIIKKVMLDCLTISLTYCSNCIEHEYNWNSVKYVNINHTIVYICISSTYYVRDNTAK